MKIKIIGHNRKIFIQPDKSNPWNVFHQQFLNAGHTLVESENESFDVLISNTYSKDQIKSCEKSKVSLYNRFLILWEPRQTNPQMYSKQIFSKYGTIFTPSYDWISGPNINKFNWPQGPVSSDNEEFHLWKLRNNKSIMVAGNKYSIIKGENYSLRRSVVSKKTVSQVIDVAGRDWDFKLRPFCSKIIKSLWRSKGKNISVKSFTNLVPKLSNYIGSVESKSQLSAAYRLALVIENSSDYISEKLFDALFAQNIVVYVGPDLAHFGLSEKMALRVQPNLNCIVLEIEKVLAMDEREQFELLKRQQFEYKKIASEWNNRIVLENIARIIVKKIKLKPTELPTSQI